MGMIHLFTLAQRWSNDRPPQRQAVSEMQSDENRYKLWMKVTR